MTDLIDRQAAIEAVINRDANCGIDSAEVLRSLPSAQPELHGYKIEHLAYIAMVMKREGISADYAVRTFDDMSRVVKMVIDEIQEKVERVLNE